MKYCSIDAREAWRGNYQECRKLWLQWRFTFKGRFKHMVAYYGWKPESMLRALRIGSR